MAIKKSITCLFLLLFLFSLSSNVFSQQYFEKDTSYDIYYEVSTYEVGIVKNVRIINIVEIGEKRFLEIFGSGLSGKKKKGYISFDIIKAILPSGHIIPEKSFIGK